MTLLLCSLNQKKKEKEKEKKFIDFYLLRLLSLMLIETMMKIKHINYVPT